MLRFNVQSVLFVAVVLIFVLWTRINRDDFIKTPLDNKVEVSSLRASVPLNIYKTNTAGFDANRATAPSLSPTRKSDAPPPEIKSSAALVKELNGGARFFEFNTYQRWPLASLTKLMTAVVAIEQIGAGKKVVVGESAIATEGVAVGFSASDVFTVWDLIKAALVVSSNDAAAALAEFFGASNFFDAMQQKAAELNMSQTSFFDSTGLSFLNQSSVGDLEKLIEYIYAEHPELLIVTREKETSITEINSQITKTLRNINYFAGNNDFLGGKTGFTDEAHGNLISIFQYRNRSILVIILGAEDRFEETGQLYKWTLETYNL